MYIYLLTIVIKTLKIIKVYCNLFVKYKFKICVSRKNVFNEKKVLLINFLAVKS